MPKQWPAQQQKKQDGHNCLCLKQVPQVDFSQKTLDPVPGGNFEEDL